MFALFEVSTFKRSDIVGSSRSLKICSTQLELAICRFGMFTFDARTRADRILGERRTRTETIFVSYFLFSVCSRRIVQPAIVVPRCASPISQMDSPKRH